MQHFEIACNNEILKIYVFINVVAMTIGHFRYNLVKIFYMRYNHLKKSAIKFISTLLLVGFFQRKELENTNIKNNNISEGID